VNELYSHKHGGAPSPGMLDFSVNITPLSLPLEPLTLDLSSFARYPSIDGSSLRGFYVERFGLEAESVLAMNGAVEGIYLIPRALGLRRVVVFAPSFHEYERASRIAGADVVKLPLVDEEGFGCPSAERIAGAMADADALFVGNPNNPTGTMLDPESLMALALRLPDRWFIVDEAFIQYTEGFPDNSFMQHVGRFPNIIVVHSLTKFYALPGLRLGAVVAYPSVIGRLLDYKEPWTVNAVAELVAGGLMECREWEDGVRTMIMKERRRMRDAFDAIERVELRGGAANFFLARWHDGPLERLTDALALNAIHVRDSRNFDGLEGEWFRFAVRTPEENGRFLRAFGEMPA